MKRSRAAILVATGLFVLFGLIQLVPYGRDHAKPPAGELVAWDSPRTLELARRACFDCHSNETRWPWYASIAPVSWRIQRHVDEGREKLDFTDFTPALKEVGEAAGEAAETVTKREMPPGDYLLAHAEANLTPSERQELIRGLRATFAAWGEGEERAGRGGAATPATGAEPGGAGGEREHGEAHEHGRDRASDRD